MKKTLLATVVLLVLWGLQSKAAQPLEKEVTIGISGAYIPAGFDSYSDAYVIVNGVFQNGCYRWKKADVTDLDTTSHVIKSIATVNQGMCLMVLVPFQKEIHLGKLQSGKHHLRFVNGDGTYLEKSLMIK